MRAARETGSGAVFQLPFTAMDETADLLERPGEPNLILLELAMSGRLDPSRLSVAVGAALARRLRCAGIAAAAPAA